MNGPEEEPLIPEAPGEQQVLIADQARQISPRPKERINRIIHSISSSPALGLLLLFISALLFCVASLCVKIVSSKLPVLHIIVWRSLSQTIFAGISCLALGVYPLGDKSVRLYLFLRGLTGAIGLAVFFITISELPLGDANAVYFTSPLWASFFSWIWLKEVFPWHNLVAGIVSFFGTLLIAQPQFLFGKHWRLRRPNPTTSPSVVSKLRSHFRLRHRKNDADDYAEDDIEASGLNALNFGPGSDATKHPMSALIYRERRNPYFAYSTPKWRRLSLMSAMMGAVSFHSVNSLGNAMETRQVSSLLMNNHLNALRWPFQGTTTAVHQPLIVMDHKIPPKVEKDTDNIDLSRSQAVWLGLMGAALGGLSYATIRKVGPGTKPMVLVLYFGVVSTLFSFPLALTFEPIDISDYNALNLRDWFVLFGVGGFAFGAQILLNWGLQLEKAGPGSFMRNLDIAFAFVFQVTILRQPIEFLSLIGAIIILGSSAFMVGMKFRDKSSKADEIK